MTQASQIDAPRQTGRVLIVDDDRRRASELAQWLCTRGGHAAAAGSAAEAARLLARGEWAACLVDADLPDAGAARVAAAARLRGPVAVVALAATEGMTAWADARVGRDAGDAAVLAALSAARSSAGRPASAIVGRHAALERVLEVVRRVAATPVTVLVTGESGTGKSLLAREIHAASGRPGAFVEVACGTLAESLLESELFGHVAGAFTGATRDRDGRFLQADRGTIFLDEIATATPALQVKLLRVLQDLRFEPVGGTTTHTVDARLVLATNERLERLVASGGFREDLFWRINVVAIEMPALRDRASDIPLLAAHFLERAARRAGRVVEGFTPAAAEALAQHAWPGNVRELQHAVERGVFLGTGPLIDLADLPPALSVGRRTVVDAAPLKEALAQPERQLIVAALEQAGWRRDVAARALGINRTTLYKKIKRLGMDLAALAPG